MGDVGELCKYIVAITTSASAAGTSHDGLPRAMDATQRLHDQHVRQLASDAHGRQADMRWGNKHSRSYVAGNGNVLSALCGVKEVQEAQSVRKT